MNSTAHLLQMFDSTRMSWSKGGQDGHRRSRGGFTTKIHAKSDASGDIIAIDLTGGRSDWRRSVRRASLRNPARYRARHSAARRHLSTKATPARPIGTPRERAASLPSFPTRPTKREQASLLRTHPLQSPLFKARARIEQGVGRLKRFKRVALRCEKTARNFNRQLRRRPLLDQIRPHRLSIRY